MKKTLEIYWSVDGIKHSQKIDLTIRHFDDDGEPVVGISHNHPGCFVVDEFEFNDVKNLDITINNFYEICADEFFTCEYDENSEGYLLY